MNEEVMQFIGKALINNVSEIEYLRKEIDRLNNVINELEKWLSENTEKMHNISGDDFTTVGQAVYQEVLDKLKELKENE